MTRKKMFWGASLALTVVAIGFGAYWVEYLRVAHSSFDNYYKFRGCTELLTKSDLDAVCKLPNGSTIKLVQVKDKWFLDGDLGW